MLKFLQPGEKKGNQVTVRIIAEMNRAEEMQHS